MTSLFALIPIAFVLSLDNFQSSIGLGTTKPPWRRIVQAAVDLRNLCDALAPMHRCLGGQLSWRTHRGHRRSTSGPPPWRYALYLVVHAMRTEEKPANSDHPLGDSGLAAAVEHRQPVRRREPRSGGLRRP